MLTYVKVLLHHLDLALFRTLLQSMLCKLENYLYHLETQRVVQVQICPESTLSRVDRFNIASSGFLFVPCQLPLLSFSLDLQKGLA